jgi:DNA-binding NarL/FixJ family response regulator
MSMIRVIVVDDHPIFRLGMAASLQDIDDVDLVGEADCAADVAGLVDEVHPDVVLLDLHLPDGSGLEVNRWIACERPTIKVIMLTMSEDHHAAVSAIQDGARGYLVKGADPKRIEHALRTVWAGSVVLDGDIAETITGLTQHRSARARPFAQLSEKEFAVLELVARGLENKAVARELFLAEKTIANYVSSIFSKLNVTSRAQAIVLAHDHGVGLADP